MGSQARAEFDRKMPSKRWHYVDITLFLAVYCVRTLVWFVFGLFLVWIKIVISTNIHHIVSTAFLVHTRQWHPKGVRIRICLWFSSSYLCKGCKGEWVYININDALIVRLDKKEMKKGSYGQEFWAGSWARLSYDQPFSYLWLLPRSNARVCDVCDRWQALCRPAFPLMLMQWAMERSNLLGQRNAPYNSGPRPVGSGTFLRFRSARQTRETCWGEWENRKRVQKYTVNKQQDGK